MKNNYPLGYFNANNLNSPKSVKVINDPWQSLFSKIVCLHLYIHHDFHHVKRLLENENANLSDSNTTFNSSTDIWLVRMPEQIEKNGTIEILKGIKVKKTTKIFYFSVHGNHNINVYDSIQMHRNFPSTLSLHSTWNLNKGFQSLEKNIWSTPRSMDGLDIVDVAAVDMTVLSEQSEVVEFLPGLMEVTEEFYMKNPGDTITFVSYIGSFTNLSWLAIASWIIFAPIFIYVMVSRMICKNEERLTLVDSYVHLLPQV